MKRAGWSWPGLIALVLALCLGGGWATALVMSASSRTPPITDSTKDLLSSIGGVLAGAVTAYIGGTLALRQRRRDESPAPPDDEPHTDTPASE